MNPESYTYGLGLAINAYRTYTGLSQRGMAEKLAMNRRTYQRIEKDEDACPPGLLDSLAAVVDKFDDDVARIIDAAAAAGGLELTVEPGQEWETVAAQRALVLSADAPITLTLAGNTITVE